MPDFEELAASRRQWIDEVLIPWCRAATLKQLARAEREWGDIAGRVDPQSTLWCWAWGRFPVLIADELQQIDETYAVTVTLQDGEQFSGFPDARRSQRGSLVLIGENEEYGPFSIDEIASVERML